MIKSLTLASLLLFGFLATTHAQSDHLAKCLADNTTGRDRKDLARWIFVSMGSHPEMRDLVLSSEDTNAQIDKRMATIVTRLMAESCLVEVQGLVKKGESDAMRRAFESLGALAMMELHSNPAVTTSVSRFGRYIDQEKLSSAINGK
jgi:hypothetical protein